MPSSQGRSTRPRAPKPLHPNTTRSRLALLRTPPPTPAGQWGRSIPEARGYALSSFERTPCAGRSRLFFFLFPEARDFKAKTDPGPVTGGLPPKAQNRGLRPGGICGGGLAGMDCSRVPVRDSWGLSKILRLPWGARAQVSPPPASAEGASRVASPPALGPLLLRTL